MSLQNTKSTLAKLLATENISVVYQNVQTASFNIESRTITLPVWNDTTPEILDLLVGHEVGHAIDTPRDYGTAQDGMPSGFRSFLNVIEDARIERRMKDRYPGLRRSFTKGYTQFLERDFFEIKDKDVNQMLLIDRINMAFKLGPMFPIEFSPEEKVFVNRIERCDTFEEVVAIAKDMYGYCQQELEEKREQAMQEFQDKLDSGEFEEDENQPDSWNEFEGDYENDGENGEFDEYGDGEDDTTTDTPSYSDPKELQDYDEVKSATDENLEKSVRKLAEKKQILVAKLPDSRNYKYDNLIVPFKKLLGKVITDLAYDPSYSDGYEANALVEFEKRNKNAVAYLVKEFEMKKKAAELRRVTISDTGTLDTNKLHTYKFNDDIFRKVGSVAAGKNHGVVMFLDWSGSMTDNMVGTIEQLISMTSFCRKVNIPFEVYAFSTVYFESTTTQRENFYTSENCELETGKHWNLLNLLSSRMKNQEYRKMANDLLNMARFFTVRYGSSYVASNMQLGGTPLNECIIASIGIVNNFKKAYRIEVTDVIYLTDGEDSSRMYVKNEHSSYSVGYPTIGSVSYIEDQETNKKYRINESGVTPVLLTILRERTQSNLIGFYIIENRKRNFDSVYRANNATFPSITQYNQFKAEKHFALSNCGYSKYFLIPGGDDLQVEDDTLSDILQDSKEVSARKLRGAFLKMNQNRLANRVLLSKVIEELV